MKRPTFNFPRIPYMGFLCGPSMAFILGLALNKIVMAFNGGAMPVQVKDCTDTMMAGDPYHTCMTAGTHLKILADWILLHPLGAMSPGDLLIQFGETTILYGLVIWAILMIKRFNEEGLE